ncbi:MAG: 16S rRNA (guanine(966)-N(2))-methyltransferase RsmD [Gemmatimonadota bacterium]|nr:MAG: 16S rRNA (guanine(966)-N(2))-methyltransferase RsmD [Gemmatimonadota bacterium]
MRITAGEFKGRQLKPPPDRRVRATTERVREAWFNILAPAIKDARVVDLFAGSGVLGLEALSRGAHHVDFVELSEKSIRTIKANVAVLGVEPRTQLYRGDAIRFAQRLAEGAYDIALADPPYTTDQATRLLEVFRQCTFARVLSVEHRATLDCPGDETRRYGDVALTFCYAS